MLADKPILDWLVEYVKIIKSYNITAKTVANRMPYVNWIRKKLGSKLIGHIKPYEIAIELKLEYKSSPSKARRLLIEIKNMFTEAIIYGWIDKNPAMYLKSQPVTIMRQRLTLEEWIELYAYAKSSRSSYAPTLLELAIITGQRRSDILKMQYSDIKDGNLLVTQQKTGTKLAIPLKLRLDIINLSLEEVIESSRAYTTEGSAFIRKTQGEPPCESTLSSVFQRLVQISGIDKNTSLHECRSLSERLYREQGINTRLLLGHKHQSMTDMYNNDRGLNKDTYTLVPI